MSNMSNLATTLRLGADYEAHGESSEPDCEGEYVHRWTREGTGGCSQNPGVWSLGGTTMRYAARCMVCGVGRTEIRHGSQRNPGERDSVRYEEHAYRILDFERLSEMRRQDRNRRARERRATARLRAWR